MPQLLAALVRGHQSCEQIASACLPTVCACITIGVLMVQDLLATGEDEDTDKFADIVSPKTQSLYHLQTT